MDKVLGKSLELWRPRKAITISYNQSSPYTVEIPFNEEDGNTNDQLSAFKG